MIYSLLMELNRSDRVFRLDGHRPHAKVPVLKLTHRPSNTNIDVVCNNVLGEHKPGCADHGAFRGPLAAAALPRIHPAPPVLARVATTFP